MGGANSEVKDDTTTVIIEAAYFAGAVVRQTSKDHSLRSEASSRFEKGVDQERVRIAGERAAALMAQYAGGTILAGSVEFDEIRVEPTVVSITLDKINTVIGAQISADEVLDIFARLKFDVKVDGETFIVTVPTRRGDITIEADLAEEVARLYGYDRIPSTLPVGAMTIGALTDYQQKRRIVRRTLEGAGLYQATTYSLTSPEKVAQFALEARESIRLAMPMSEERSQLRLSIVPQLLEAVKYNNARQLDSVAFYEVGSVFLKQEEGELPLEREHVAGAITGLWEANLWQGEKKPVDFYVAKGVIEAVFDSLGVLDKIEYRKAAIKDMHPGRTAQVLLNGENIGFIGQVHPTLQKEYDLKETYVFELSFKALAEAEVAPIAYEMIPRFPSVTRDIALVVDKEKEAGELQSIITKAGGKLLKEVQLFDFYQGEHMEEGKKSLAFSLKYYDPEKTLTDEEIVKVHDQVLEAVKEQAGAVLRG
jgi:phenylalanyl-tRNA synthetase beta chain